MEPALFSIDKAPKALPVWESIIDDLGYPPAHRVARVLGVGRSTVYRWNAEGHGPRIACLALFWLTRWGRSQVDTQATNDAVLHVQLARSLGEERDKLVRQVEALDRENRELTYDLARTKMLTFDRGNGPSASHSHTGTEPADWTAPARLAQLAWPALTGPAGDLLERAEPTLCGRRGSPVGTLQAVRSERFPDSARTDPPPPSDPRESVRLSPSDEVSYHGGVIMASTHPPSSGLLEVGQARPLRGPAGVGVIDGVQAPGLRPAQQRRAWAEAASLPAAAAARPDDPTAAFHDAQGTNRGTPGATHAAGLGGGWGIRSAGIELDARSGTPPSAAWPERPTSLGQAPDPAPRAPGAPPGHGAFDAIVRAASGPVSALQR